MICDNDKVRLTKRRNKSFQISDGPTTPEPKDD